MSSRVLHALLEALAAATAATDVWVTDTQPSEWRVVEAVGPHAATLGAGAWPGTRDPPRPDVEVLRVPDLVRADEDRTHRQEGV